MIREHRVIDSHCHIYPPKIAAKAVAGTDRFYDSHSVLDGSAETLLRAGTAAGVDHFMVCSVATTPHQVQSINRFIAAEVAASGGRFTGLGTLHAESDDIQRDVEEIISLGLRGVKLHPDIQAFKLDDYRCLRMFELCEGRLPILIHTGDARYDYSNPNRLLPILETYTELTIIGAHFGTYSIWNEAPRLYGIPNFYVDCSSTQGFLTPQRVRELIVGYGADRVLFGTDYPMWHAADELERLLDLGLSEEEQARIFHKNAEKVFGI